MVIVMIKCVAKLMDRLKNITIVLLSFLELSFNPIEAIAQQPNFVFYLADDQDMLDYGCYGNPMVHTPAVDKLASEGMKFNRAFTAQAICSPSRSQLYTGKYPLKNGCYVNHYSTYEQTKSITHYLKALGYDVILAGKSHVGPDKVFDWTYYFEDEPNDSIGPHSGIPLKKIQNYLDTVTRPFCMFITSHYPHGPYPKSTSYNHQDIYPLPYTNNANWRVGYYENIKTDNYMLSVILNMIDTDDKSENTVFVYSSDHGINGKFTVSEAGLRIPMIVRWPGKVKAGSISNAMVHMTDILPTFLEIAGGETPSDIDGKSFLPVLRGEKDSHHDYVYGVAHKQNTQHTYIFPSRMIRGEKYKYIMNTNAQDALNNNLGTDQAVNIFIRQGANWQPEKPFEELYDVQNDPWEKNNLADRADFDSIKNEMSERLKAWLTEQEDFILDYPAPVLWANLHTLDKTTTFNKIPPEMEGILSNSDLYRHYPEKASFAPRNLRAELLSSNRVKLSWTPSIYNKGVVGYQIILNDEIIEVVKSNTTVINYSQGVKVQVFVRAVNNSGQVSKLSAPIDI